MKVYVIGSLRNPNVPLVAEQLRKAGYDAFDDWYAPGPDTDDYWRDYEKGKGSTYRDALKGHAAQHVFHFDKWHLDASDAAVLVMPAGKSCHLELGYMVGRGKPTFILFDEEPERFDVMHNFAAEIFFDVHTLIKEGLAYVRITTTAPRQRGLC